MNRTRILASLITPVLVAMITATSVNAALSSASATSQSVTLNWTAVGDDGGSGTAAMYDIRYSTVSINDASWNSAIQVSDEPTPQSAGTPESYTVNSLEPATTYYFAIKVADEAGNWSPLSNVVQKTTDQETTPPSAIASLISPSNGSTTIDLAWTAPGDDDDIGTAAEYDLRISTSPIDAGNFDAATRVTGLPAPQTAGSSESFTVTNLSSGTSYYFAIKTADEVPNWSAISNVISVTTGAEQISPSIVADLGVGNPTATSLTVSWTAPGDDADIGTASEYDLRYSTSMINAASFDAAPRVNGIPAPNPAGSFESYVVTGLDPDTRYYFALRTADEVPNWSAISNVPSGQTLIENIPPSIIANLGAGSETETSITLSWTAPGDDGTSGQAAQYDIRYSLDPITEQSWDLATQVANEPSPQPSGSAETYVVSGLNSNTTYYFAVKTADEVPNWSGLSNVVTRRTAADQTAPSAIDDLQASSGVGDGEIMLGWTAPDDGALNRMVAGYDIRASFDSIQESNWNSAIPLANPPDPVSPGQPQAVMLAGLEPGQFYFVAVKSYDEAGNYSAVSANASAFAGFDFATGTEDQIAELVSPLPGASVPTAHPVLVVINANPDSVDLYRFEVALDSTFYDMSAVGLVLEADSNLTAWEVDAALEEGPVYFWRVMSSTGDYSAVSSFTVAPAPHAFPNPFVADDAVDVTFADLAIGSDLTLTNVSGQIVRQWTQLDQDRISWDGTNDVGNQVASGVYMWYLSGTGQKGKLVVVR